MGWYLEGAQKRFVGGVPCSWEKPQGTVLMLGIQAWGGGNYSFGACNGLHILP